MKKVKSMKGTVKKVIEYECHKHIGVISANEDESRCVELNIVSFEGRAPRYDLRVWKSKRKGSEIGKGVTMTFDELRSLYGVLGKYLSEHQEDELKLFSGDDEDADP